MKILITGGAGFIGQHLARLLTPEHHLTALDSLLPQVHLDPEASRAAFPGEVIVGDVCDPQVWADLQPHDAVIHLAAETGTGQSMYEQDRYIRVNVGGTSLAGQTAAAWGAPIVALSSRAVYGNGRFECPVHEPSFGEPCCDQAQPADSHEDDTHRPVSVYGETKSDGERVLTEVGASIGVSIIRPQNVVGPGQALHNPYTGVLAAFLARLREDKSLLVYGDGSATRDFVHVRDVAALIAWCVANPADPGSPRILNCGTGVRTDLTQLASAAIEGSPRTNVPIEHVEVTRAGDIDHACADLTRLREVGAPTPLWTSHDAIVEFIRWSWDKPGASSQAWDDALTELDERGLTR